MREKTCERELFNRICDRFSIYALDRVGITQIIDAIARQRRMNPLRIRVQDFIDRRFFRKKYDADQTLAKFAAIARDEVDFERLVKAMNTAVTESLRPEDLNLWICEPDSMHETINSKM